MRRLLIMILATGILLAVPMTCNMQTAVPIPSNTPMSPSSPMMPVNPMMPGFLPY